MTDELIVNLKVIGTVKKHEKLITKDTFLNIEPCSLIPECVRRWRRGDTRDATVHKISTTIDAALQATDNPLMASYLSQCKVGIENMKDTYSSCRQTCARLDSILDRISLVDVRSNPPNAVRMRVTAGSIEHGLADADTAQLVHRENSASGDRVAEVHFDDGI